MNNYEIVGVVTADQVPDLTAWSRRAHASTGKE